MRVRLHIGMNKAASTSIQDMLHDNPGLLAARGYHFEPEGCRLGDRAAVRARNSERGLGALRKRLLCRCDRQRERFTDLIVSSEHFWVPPMLFGLDAARESAEAARRLFRDMPTDILVVLRRQEGYIESGYHWKLKAVPGFRMDFAEYLRRLHLERYDYGLLLAPWEEVFGRDHVRVVQFEHLKKDPQRFVRLLFAALGLDLTDGELPRLPWANPGLSRQGVEYVLRQPLKVVTRDEQKELRSHLEREFAKTPKGRESLLSPEQRQALAERFRESNAALLDRYGLEPGLWA